MKPLLSALLLCTASLTATAQQYYENPDYKHFQNVIESEAEKGNIVAIKELGDCYNYGTKSHPNFTDRVDYDKACELYKTAADYGYPYASWEMGRMYGAGKLKDTDGNAKEMWFDKAMNDFKVYSDRGDAEAMEHLAEMYGGYCGDKYKDYLKSFYWALCALDAGAPSAATDVAFCYEYGKGVDKDSVFALAWYARFCVEADKRKWGAESYPAYKELSRAGYTRNDWTRLAEPTYYPIPRVLTQNEDSINDIVIFAADLMSLRARDFRIAHAAHEKAAATTVSAAKNESFTASTIPLTTAAATKAAQPNQKRNWLSAIGRALDAASTAAGGQTLAAGMAQALSGNAAAADATSTAEAFRYTGEQRKGKRDFNGRIIKNEINAPCVYGQAHYTWYEDGYCYVQSVTTCVGCYGKKICTLCNGSGKYYHAYFKNYMACKSCLGSGRCKYCDGAGGKIQKKLWAPGEAEAYLAASREDGDSSSSSSSGSSRSSSGSSSSSSRTTCPKCNGARFQAQRYEYAAASAAGWMQPYHNKAGEKCSICSYATDHYHNPCTECHGYGRVKK